MKMEKKEGIENWKFVKDLRSPLHRYIEFKRKQKKEGEVDLSVGVELKFQFPDDKRCLSSAYDDFKRFLKVCQINTHGQYKIVTERIPTNSFETYIVEVKKDFCRILSNDTEGIRRGLIFVEDEIQRNKGPFLKIGSFERFPFIKTRISRCFFGPIKRPPMNRDELADDIDYYPEEYLNRLAHESINGLWLTIEFNELCPSKFFPEHGKDRFRRLEKLNKVVDKCAKYGIKIYVFCIEPKAFGNNSYYLLPLKELNGKKYFEGHHLQREPVKYFCTSSKEGQEYLEECTQYLFSSVPGLGGLIDINLGERPTHCYSSPELFFNNNCPRCSRRKPYEVFADTTLSLARGMKKVNPSAEMISWLYVPYIPGKNQKDIEKKQEVIYQIAKHTPEEVILQYNFESGGKDVQLKKERYILDYSLAWPGPSKIFTNCAKNAINNGARVSAKIQVGCSHEVATVPFVPVPGNLYKKYKAMHKLKVSSVMQCWYFGNYPGLMNKAAGELSFSPFHKSEYSFLFQLARINWGNNAKEVVKAWKYFQKGYSNFPLNLSFSWYGPVHNSVVWPLYLLPVDAPISPSWKFTFPLESGDRIGECICYDHTLEEILILLKRMSYNWNKGTEILEKIEPEYKDNLDRILDIGIAKALNIQMSSAYNVIKFYSLRESLPYLTTKEQKKKLAMIKNIVQKEIKNSLFLRELCLKDSRLGFHSEAEGYKYSPEKLKKRAELLKCLLTTEFVEMQQKIERGEKLFPEYTGVEPKGKKYIASRNRNDSLWEKLNDENTKWRALYDEKNIHFEIEYPIESIKDNSTITLKVEPCRLWPAQTFQITKDGEKRHNNFKVVEDNRWDVKISQKNKLQNVLIAIPFELFKGYYTNGRPMRINIIRDNHSWVALHPWETRLRFGSDNPADLGWLFYS